jgi:hypothetical protein
MPLNTSHSTSSEENNKTAKNSDNDRSIHPWSGWDEIPGCTFAKRKLDEEYYYSFTWIRKGSILKLIMIPIWPL